MPFTLFHPAAALPLRRLAPRWASVTGLVAGSVAPDFEKLLLLRPGNGHSHTWASLLYFSLPLGLVLAAVFQGLVRRPLLAHLPAAWRARLSTIPFVHWPAHLRRCWLQVVVSVLLGAGTHLAWDAWTHYQPEHSPYARLLNHEFFLSGSAVPVWVLLNGASSLLAAAGLAWTIGRRPLGSAAGATPCRILIFWGWVCTAGLLSAAARASYGGSAGNFWAVGITAVSGSLLGLLIACSYLRFR